MIKNYLLLFIIIAVSSPALAGRQTHHEDISYGTASVQQKLDIYTPHKRVKNAPVLVYVHGGGWTNGDKQNVAVRGSDLYTNEGIIVVSLNYRLTPEVVHPGHIEDLALATQWLKNNISNYGGDPTNMLLVGHSAGAHLVALLGTNQNYLPSYQLPMNVYKAILPIDTASFDLTIPQEGKLAKLVQKRRDEAFGLEKATLVDASPTLQIRPGLSLSTFVVFATAERPEAVAQGDIFVNTLNENGYRAQNARIDGGHTHRDMNMAIFEKRSPISLTIINFLKK